MTGTQQVAFSFDAAACSGCKACQVACKDKHGLEVGLLWRRVYAVEGGQWRRSGEAWIADVFAYHLSIACNHCLEPICAEVCPAQAITKREDGIVLLDGDKCLGCGYCSWACPYGALQFDAGAGRMTKCTFCVDEIDAGRPPACVAACPMRVLDFRLQTGVLDKKNGHFPLPAASLTGPALILKPHQDGLRSREEVVEVTPQPSQDMNALPLVAFSFLSQMAAGLYLVIALLSPVPAAAGGFERSLTLLGSSIMSLALLTSLFHLAKPRLAYRALANQRSSWLSREILLACTCFLVYWLQTALTWLKPGLIVAGLGLGWAGALAGLSLVYSMARVYKLRTIPSWDKPVTFPAFLVTALIGGFTAFGFMLVVGEPPTGRLPYAWSAVWLSAFGLLLLAEWLLITAWLNGLNKDRAAEGAGAGLPAKILHLTGLRIALTLAGALLMGALIPGIVPRVIPPSVSALSALVAVLLILASEIIGRFLFYRSYQRFGL